MRMFAACLSVLLATSATGVGAGAPETAASAATDTAANAAANAGAAPGGVPQAALDRETLVRFSRAYGMAKGILDEHGMTDTSPDAKRALLRDPEQLEQPLRDEVYEIIGQNRLDATEWQAMFAQMEEDPALRERIESLSIPFGY
jgi:hypothetical protein